MKATEVTVIIPTVSYGNITCRLPEITSLEEVMSLRDDIVKKQVERMRNCEHLFPDTMKAKSGLLYRSCPECDSQSYQDKDGNWSLWKRPLRS